jgi:hypothetical protein
MAYQSLGIGAAADDGTGDSLRIGGDKINDNFSEIYTLFGTGTALVTGISAGADDFTFVGENYNAVWDKSASALNFLDNAKAMFGTGNDLQIWHDGTHSHIHDVGTGNLYIKTDGTGIELQDTSGKQMGVFTKDGAATLYHNNSAKIATASAGVSVTGTVVTSGNIELGTSATLIFEGATANAHEMVLTVTDPTADRTITLPNVTGTVITTGDSGTVTSEMIADGTIVSGDIANGTIVTADLADNSITSAKIVDATIVSADIAADTIAESNMANDAIGSAELKTLSTLLIKDSGGGLLKTCHCAGV